MKVSVITVCFNSVSTIRDTIESVLSQSYKDIEYIIIDGGSKDGTLDVIEEYKNKIATVITEPDKGIYDAMNKGIKIATGEIVGILNSDDFYSSSKSVQFLMEKFNDDIDGVYADLVYIKQNNEKKIARYYSSKNFSKKLLRFGFMPPHPTYYIRKSMYHKFGIYKLNYRVSADFELIARHVKKGIRLSRVPRVVVKMRSGGISSSGFLWRVHQNFEIVRACRENSIKTSIFLLLLKVPYKLFGYLSSPNKIED